MLKKYMFISLILCQFAFGQDTIVKIPNVQDRVLYLGNKEYKVFSSLMTDSTFTKKLYDFPLESFRELQGGLGYISSTDTLFGKFIQKSTDNHFNFFSIDKDDQVVEGIEFVVGQDDEYSLVLFKEGNPLYRYRLNRDYDKLMQLEGKEVEAFSNQNLSTQKEGFTYFTPLKEDYKNSLWEESNVLEHLQEVISNNSTVHVFKVGGDSDVLLLHLIKQKEDGYLLLKRNGTLISISEIDNASLEIVPYVNVTSLINIGYDQKRATITTVDGDGLWDVYLEEVSSQPWKATHQNIYYYTRVSDNRKMRMRVVMDSSVSLSDIYKNTLLAFGSNPELFRRDIHLDSFDYSMLLEGRIELNSSAKPKYILTKSK